MCVMLILGLPHHLGSPGEMDAMLTFSNRLREFREHLFWSFDDVVNMFPVRFELKKHLRIISEHSEHAKQFLAVLKLLHGV